MRRWMATPPLFAIAAAIALMGEPAQVAAQKVDPPVEESFLTADGVQLRGLFHRSTKDPANAPVVILLYPPGRERNKETDMTKGDWEGLANRLNKEGYHVFRFDWRGHGKKGSDIRDPSIFWGNPHTAAWNFRYINGAGKKPIKGDLYFKDLKDPVKYAPTYLLDLAAVRTHLDSKNDAGDVNTSSIYLIGAEAAATIGIAWMATEWNRPAFAPTPNQLIFPAPSYEFVPQPLNGGIKTSAGEDISAAIWLSPHRPTSISENQIKTWINTFALKIRDNNPMLFMYSEKDMAGKRYAEFFHNVALVGKGDKRLGLNPINDRYLHMVKGANTLSGAALLGNNATLKTEDTMLEFMAAIQKERAKITRKNRNFTAPWFISLATFGFSP
jgi:hypothetical protein